MNRRRLISPRRYASSSCSLDISGGPRLAATVHAPVAVRHGSGIGSQLRLPGEAGGHSMCGIAGCVVAVGGSPDRAALDRMASALRHRGPDDSGVEVVGNAGLVSTRLAIVAPSPAGHEPMRDAGGRWWLSYNGEVFNHLELRRRLGARDWRGGRDTETLVNALAEWGDDAPRRCNGFFAFAGLDTGARRLLLVRDRFGVKPLYWARHGGALWFASEIAALLAAGVPRRLERGALAYALMYGWSSGAATPVEGVRRVLPGTMIEVGL